MDDQKLIDYGKETLAIEMESMTMAMNAIGDSFAKAVRTILTSNGRIVITGMGKSGHIGQKIAATLASTGTPAFFLHPAEAVHGDLGMLVRGDVVLALSHSGETDEIKRILPIIKRLSIPLISITGNTASTLAKMSDAVLDSSIKREACPMYLAPTTSTTVALALGDALAVALVHERGFKEEDFALVHPSGSLGKRLLLTVQDLWHSGDALPVASIDTAMKDLLYIISSKGFGCTAIVDDEGGLIGIVTDGDLRRAMEKNKDVLNMSVADIMSKNPKRISPTDLAASAMAIMEKYAITSLIATDQMGKPTGILHMHDLIKAGMA